MPSSAEWCQFLHNNENKTSLISLMVEYFCSEEGRSTLKYPLIITRDEYTYKVTNDVVEPGKTYYIKIKEKIRGNTSVLSNLSELGKEPFLANSDIENAITFIQRIIYTGNHLETYVSTRIRLYENQPTKTSMRIPPDPRAHYQLYVWTRCLQQNIEHSPRKQWLDNYRWYSRAFLV